LTRELSYTLVVATWFGGNNPFGRGIVYVVFSSVAYKSRHPQSDSLVRFGRPGAVSVFVCGDPVRDGEL